MKFRPTHKCYDDALDFLQAWVKENIERARRDCRDRSVMLAHGICRCSEKGTPYAHAWVEIDGQCYNGALDESGTRVYVEFDREVFHRLFGVIEVNYYSIERAWKENHRTGHYGPWTEEHRALTGPPGTLVKVVQEAGA